MNDNRELMVDIEKLRLSYDFSKTSFMLLMVLFSSGMVIASILGKGGLVTPVALVGMFVCFMGLILTPRFYNNELDKLGRKTVEPEVVQPAKKEK